MATLASIALRILNPVELFIATRLIEAAYDDGIVLCNEHWESFFPVDAPALRIIGYKVGVMIVDGLDPLFGIICKHC